MPLDPIPFPDALRIVNQNVERIGGTLRASGAVDGLVTLADGRTRSYHADAILFFLVPDHVRFDLKVLGERQFLFGANDEYTWCYSREDRAYRCGRRDEDGIIAPELPLRPDQMLDLLGLRPVVPESAVQRVVEEFQQVLFVVHDETDGILIQKEYWLDRYPPRLVRRVVFRDADGVVTMESRLDDYAALAPGGPSVPYHITADWPESGARMSFRVSRWTLVESVGRDGIQFATPRECLAP